MKEVISLAQPGLGDRAQRNAELHAHTASIIEELKASMKDRSQSSHKFWGLSMSYMTRSLTMMTTEFGTLKTLAKQVVSLMQM